MKKIRSAILGAAILASAASLQAQVDFGTAPVIEEILTVAEIRSAIETAIAPATLGATLDIDGVEIGPLDGSDRTLFLVHRSATEKVFAQINLTSKAAVFTKTSDQLKTDLGGVYAAETNFPILVSELIYSATDNAIYFADSSTAEAPTFDQYALLKIDVATGTASEILRDSSIGGLNSHGVLNDGTLVLVLGEEHEALGLGEPQIGLLNPNDVTPTYTMVYDMDDFIAEFEAFFSVAGVTECPPEAIGIHPVTGQVFAFAHDEDTLFSITDIGGTPALAVAVPAWSGLVDFHGVAVDADGNIYGFDEAGNESIAYYDAAADAPAGVIELDDIATALGIATFEVTTWRGLKAELLTSTTSRAYLASGNADAGIVAITFGDATSVSNWELY